MKKWILILVICLPFFAMAQSVTEDQDHCLWIAGLAQAAAVDRDSGTPRVQVLSAAQQLTDPYVRAWAYRAIWYVLDNPNLSPEASREGYYYACMHALSG